MLHQNIIYFNFISVQQHGLHSRHREPFHPLEELIAPDRPNRSYHLSLPISIGGNESENLDLSDSGSDPEEHEDEPYVSELITD